jgi:hypothetical protein
MPMKEHYEIEFDNRMFDNVLDAVHAASEVSVDRRLANMSSKVKIYRVVMYTHREEPVRTTLQSVDIPAGIDMAFLNDPLNPVLHAQRKEELLPGFKPCVGCGRK